MNAVPYDVAVVGFGPTGAIAAALLARQGLRVFVCDRQREVYDKPRAIGFDHEVLRVFQNLGLLERIEPYCAPMADTVYYGVEGQVIRRVTVPPPPYFQGHVPAIVFTQPDVERVVRDAVTSHANVTVQTGQALSAIQQDEDAVTLTLRSEGGEERRVAARYAIGCDGASSTTRSLVGLSLEDLDFDEPWLVVDVLVNERGAAKTPKTIEQHCRPERTTSYVIGPGSLRRWEFSLPPGVDRTVPFPLERIWGDFLAGWIGPEDGTLWRQATYEFHALVVNRWRVGRVFIAGDAAHQQPPFLGQGLAQGIRDVANLSWKLGAVSRGDVRGSAAERLLDSYGEERKPFVQDLTSTVKGIGAVLCERDPAKALERDRRLTAEMASGAPIVRQELIPSIRGGFLAEQTPAAGRLFPQPWVLLDGHRRARLDEVVGSDWLVVTSPSFDGAPTVAALQGTRARHVALGRSIVEAHGVLAAWFETHGVGAAIVRPDHYVYGTAVDAASLDRLLFDLNARLSQG